MFFLILCFKVLQLSIVISVFEPTIPVITRYYVCVLELDSSYPYCLHFYNTYLKLSKLSATMFPSGVVLNIVDMHSLLLLYYYMPWLEIN